MCPVTIGTALGAKTAASAAIVGTSAIMGTTQSVLAIQGQRQAAKAQGRAQAAQTRAEQVRLLQQQSAERINQRFQQQQVSDQLQKAQVKAMEARATARTSAGEAGVAGVSVDALTNDLTRKEAIYRFGLQRQTEQTDIATELRMQDNNQRSYQTMLSINRPIEQPNYLEGILRGANTGLNAYGTLSNIKT